MHHVMYSPEGQDTIYMQIFMYYVSRVRHANNKIRTMAEHPETSKTAVHA